MLITNSYYFFSAFVIICVPDVRNVNAWAEHEKVKYDIVANTKLLCKSVTIAEI